MDKELYRVLKKERTQIDRAMYIIGLIGPMATLPQIWSIYSSKSAAGISVLSWVFYLVTALTSLAYSVAHKLKPLILGNLFWIFVHLIVIYGCLKY